jgi:L-2,4-diaminobutyrate decarboxylase
VRFHAEYLNPEDQAQSLRPNLVDRSLQTTRRFDALKLYMSLRHLGKDGYQRVIDGAIDLAKIFASRLSQLPDFELAVYPQTTIVLFRYCQSNNMDLDELNSKLQLQLYEEGKLTVSKTRIRGSIFLKANCMNPLLEVRHLEIVLDEIRILAHRIQEVSH